jgi:Flp pilus assembly protein TadD
MKISSVVFSAISLLLVSSACYAQTDWQKALAKGYHELAVGNTENAIAIFSSKVKGHSDSAACHTALGRAYKRMGRMDDAKTEFRQATQLEPDYPDGFYELGVIEEFDNNWSSAASAFERYLVLKPDASERRALEDRVAFCKGHIKN